MPPIETISLRSMLHLSALLQAPPRPTGIRALRHRAEVCPAQQPLSPWRILLPPLALMAGLWWFPPDAIDLWLADAMAIPGIGFPYKHQPFLEVVLHDMAKQALVAVGIGHCLLWLGAGRWGLPRDRKPLLYVFLAMLLATGIVKPLKTLTEVQCPWSLQRYGGTELYSGVFDPRPAPVAKAGECWPAGHAATGFSLVALFFGWRERRPRLARAGLWASIGLGTLLGLGRMLQGAHFLSHTLWSALIEWALCGALYCLFWRPLPAAPTAHGSHPPA